MDSLARFLAGIFKSRPDGAAKNGTHAGLIKAMGLLVERSRRAPRSRPGPVPLGSAYHRLRTFAPNTPNRKAHRGVPLQGARRTHDVPVYYQPREDRSRYTGEKLRAIRAGGKHR